MLCLTPNDQITFNMVVIRTVSDNFKGQWPWPKFDPPFMVSLVILRLVNAILSTQNIRSPSKLYSWCILWVFRRKHQGPGTFLISHLFISGGFPHHNSSGEGTIASLLCYWQWGDNVTDILAGLCGKIAYTIRWPVYKWPACLCVKKGGIIVWPVYTLSSCVHPHTLVSLSLTSCKWHLCAESCILELDKSGKKALIFDMCRKHESRKGHRKLKWNDKFGDANDILRMLD